MFLGFKKICVTGLQLTNMILDFIINEERVHTFCEVGRCEAAAPEIQFKIFYQKFSKMHHGGLPCRHNDLKLKKTTCLYIPLLSVGG